MSTGTLILKDINSEYPDLRFRVVWTSTMNLTKILGSTLDTTLQNQYRASHTITARLYYEGPSTPVSGQVLLSIGTSNYPLQFTSFSSKTYTYTKEIQVGIILSGQKKDLDLPVSIQAEIDGKSSSIGRTYLLTTYTSYSPCGWNSGANIHTAATYCIPGNRIDVNWTPAANGGAAEVKGYTIFYRFYPGLGSGSNGAWMTTNNTSSKITHTSIPVPSTAADPKIRSKYLQVRVKAISAVRGYDSISDLTNTHACEVNHIPPVPTVVSPGIISYTKESAEFKIKQGVDIDGHQLYLYYRNEGAEWLEATLSQGNFIYPLEEGQSANLEFRNFDGYEFSEPTGAIFSARNSKPAIDVMLAGSDKTLPYIKIIPSNGQQTNNTYSYQIFDINGTLLQSLSKKVETASPDSNVSFGSSEVLDIRELMSRAVGPLNEATTYKYVIKVQRNDGIDNSDIFSEIYSFKTPIVTLTNGRDDDFNQCFCDVLQVNLNGWEKTADGSIVIDTLSAEKYGLYTDVEYMNQIGTFENNVATIDTSELDYGAKTFMLLFNQYIALELEKTLSKVKRIEFTPSKGNSTVFVNPVLKPYTQDLFVQLRGFSNLGDYGLKEEIPKLSLTKSGSEISFTLNAREESNNDFYSYQVTKEDFWEWCKNEQQSDFTGTIEITLGMRNIFDKEFTQNFLLKLDFKEEPIFKSGLLYAKCDNLSKEETSLDKWQYLIEKMPIWANLTFESYNPEPTIEIKCLQDNISISNATIELTDITESQSPSTPGKPNTYEVDKSIFELPSFVAKTSLDFVAIIKNKVTEIEKKIYENLPAEGFVPALIKLNRAEYKDGNLEVNWQITNFGYNQIEKEDNSSTTVEGTGKAVGVEIYPTTYDSSESLATFNITEDQSQNSTGNGVKENFEGFNRGEGELPYDYIYIAPKLITSLATYLINGTVPYFEITKKTTSINSIIVYNLMPTVAYRQNHLGINTNNLDNMIDAVLVIGSHSTRNKIYLRTLKGDMEINLSDGTIKGNDMEINLSDGIINGSDMTINLIEGKVSKIDGSMVVNLTNGTIKGSDMTINLIEGKVSKIDGMIIDLADGTITGAIVKGGTW